MRNFLLILVLATSTAASATSKIITSFVNANSRNCEAWIQLAQACEKASVNGQKLEIQIAGLNQDSNLYAKLKSHRLKMKDAEEYVCDYVNKVSKYEMAVASVAVTQPAVVSLTKLNRGALGRVEFSPSQVVGESVVLSSPQVKMTVYGNMYCLSKAKSNGVDPQALESIASEILRD